MYKKYVKILQASSLCKHMQEDIPEKVFMLLSGRVAVAKNTLSGKRMLLAQIGLPGEMFGEIYAFRGMPSYDMYAQAAEESTVLKIGRSIFLDGWGDTEEISRTLKNNLLSVFAEKAYRMNQKLRVTGYASIREKIIHFLLERQGRNGELPADLSREEMADYLNVTRPSLSRELGKMQAEGILKLERKKIRILDQEKLELYSANP